MYSFSDHTLKILYNAGWSQERAIDVSKYRRFYYETYQPVSETILSFLQSFGDLELIYASKSHAQFQYVIEMNPVRAFATISSDDLFNYTLHWIQKPLCLIGVIASIHLVMTPDGETYLVYDSYVLKKGSSGAEAIEKLCSAVPGEPISHKAILR